MRVCKECNLEKDVSEFFLENSKNDEKFFCKSCFKKLQKKEYNRKYYENNKEKIIENQKKYYEENKEQCKDYKKSYNELNSDRLKVQRKSKYENNKETIKEKSRKYYNLNKDEINLKRRLTKKSTHYYHKNKNKDKQLKQSYEYRKMKMKTEPFYKFKHQIRILIRESFRRGFTTKSKKTIEILGCSFEEFKIHLESRFDDKMNWENQGTYWHMVHRIPISSAETEEDVYRLNHYTNFQPLYWEDNLKKSNKIYG
jgi:hypothetical protein